MTAQDHDPAARAIARLLAVRDEIELAARPPGELVILSRQAVESVLNYVGIAARLIRQMAEDVS